MDTFQVGNVLFSTIFVKLLASLDMKTRSISLKIPTKTLVVPGPKRLRNAAENYRSVPLATRRYAGRPARVAPALVVDRSPPFTQP